MKELKKSNVAVLQADHYGETEADLRNSLIVQDMAHIPDSEMDKLTHEDGSPTFEFMALCNKEYDRRGGNIDRHIGAVANAICQINGYLKIR